jgi:hypothetical protein
VIEQSAFGERKGEVSIAKRIDFASPLQNIFSVPKRRAISLRIWKIVNDGKSPVELLEKKDSSEIMREGKRR